MIGRRNVRTLWVLSLAAFLVLATLPSQRAEAEELGIGGDQQIAEMSVLGGSVSFAPRIGFEELTLTVAGQGHALTQVFRTGETPAFTPVDSEGFSLPDGTYKWEIVVSPRPEDLNLKAFKNGTISADGRTVFAAEAPSAPRQSGSFTIANGAMVNPNLREPESTRTLGAPDVAAAPSAAARSAEQSDRDGN